MEKQIWTVIKGGLRRGWTLIRGENPDPIRYDTSQPKSINPFFEKKKMPHIIKKKSCGDDWMSSSLYKKFFFIVGTRINLLKNYKFIKLK